MQDLRYWENKIQEKRKKTPWRKFVMELSSWYGMSLICRDTLISRYPETARSPIITSTKMYFSDIDTHDTYGQEYSSWEAFFQQFQDLFLRIPLQSVHDFRGDSENSDYADIISSSKNVYLSWNVTRGNENILYSLWIKENCKNVSNSVMVWDNSENVFTSIGIIKSYDIFYSKYIHDSHHIWFSTNLNACTECLFCDNLTNASYYIRNEQYSKEEYFLEKNKILHSPIEFERYFSELSNRGMNPGSRWKINGVFILNSENVENGLYVYNLKDARNIILSWYSYGIEKLYDAIFCGMKSGWYGVLCSGLQAENIYNSFWISGGMNNYYCYACEWGCSFCLGCVGLKNKSFCILNKQYTKEEWYELADKIFTSMEKDGTLWDFFPGNMNPFYFNDTMAYLIDDSFTKEEVEKEGYMWRDKAIKVGIPEGAEIVRSNELDTYQWYDRDGNWQINPDIMTKVIVDKKGNYYKIVPMEYEFLMKHILPLPEIHWLERIKTGFRFQ